MVPPQNYASSFLFLSDSARPPCSRDERSRLPFHHQISFRSFRLRPHHRLTPWHTPRPRATGLGGAAGATRGRFPAQGPGRSLVWWNNAEAGDAEAGVGRGSCFRGELRWVVLRCFCLNVLYTLYIDGFGGWYGWLIEDHEGTTNKEPLTSWSTSLSIQGILQHSNTHLCVKTGTSKHASSRQPRSM